MECTKLPEPVTCGLQAVTAPVVAEKLNALLRV